MELTEGQSSQACPRCGEHADQAGWCGVCGQNLRPDTPDRQSQTAAARGRLWADDPDAARSHYANSRAAQPTDDMPALPASPPAQFAAPSAHAAAPPPASPPPAALTAAGPDEDEHDPNPLGMGVALLGALALVICEFLPYVQVPPEFPAGVQDNTIVQSGGWWFLVFAVGSAAAVWRSYALKTKPVAPIIIGILALGGAILIANEKDTRTLTPAPSALDDVFTNNFNDPRYDGILAKPGVGVYVAGAGGALVIVGGFMMRGQAPRRRSTPQPAASAPAAAAAPPPPPLPPTPAGVALSRVQQLQALAELRESGALSQDEFDSEKARILRADQET